jgi:hypothetical protein
MALTATTPKATVMLALEATPGEQLLLAATPGAATITGISAPPGTNGGKAHVIITNWTASGTFTITGTGTPGNTETVTVAAPNAQQAQSPQLVAFDYVSVNNYTAITNITTTGGLATSNATFVVKGITGADHNVPTLAFVSDRKVPPYSGNAHTGLMARDVHVTATNNQTSIDSFDTDLYGDLSLWWPYMEIGYVSVASIPASPTSLLATTALTSSPVVLTTPPTAPAMKFIITATGYVATPVTLTLSGTSYGLSVTETITINANGAYYSSNVYSAFTNITTSSNSSGVSIAVTGVFGWALTFNEEGTRYTAAIEHFDGSASWVHPFSAMDGGDVTIQEKGNSKLTAKGKAQNKLAIGDRTTNPLQTSRVTSIAPPLGDLPLDGWQTLVYADAITGTAKTTLYTDPEEEIKITVTAKVEEHYTFNGTQDFTRAYPMKPEFMVTLSNDIQNLLQWTQSIQNLKQYLVIEQRGRQLGTVSNVTYYEGWVWTLPVRYNGKYGQVGDPNKGNTYAKPELRCEYDAGIGASLQLVCYTQNPPTYTL